MDTASDIHQLTAILAVVERRNLDGLAYVALVAACPQELPQFAHDLVQLVAAHPEVTFPTDKLVGALRQRIGRLQAIPQPAASTIVDATSTIVEEVPANGKPKSKQAKPKRVKPASQPEVHMLAPGPVYDDSPAGERRELAELVDRVRDNGTGAFSDYVNDPDRISCGPIQMLALREPDCLGWSGERLVEVLSELVLHSRGAT